MNKSARIVFASRDQQVVERLREIVGPGGIEVLSLTDLALPEPSCPERHTARMAAYKATVIAALTDLPALGYARSFRIDPLLRWGGGGPQWSWPFPWPHATEELAVALRPVPADCLPAHARPRDGCRRTEPSAGRLTLSPHLCPFVAHVPTSAAVPALEYHICYPSLIQSRIRAMRQVDGARHEREMIKMHDPT